MLSEDPWVIAEVAALFPDAVAEGTVDRQRIAEHVFTDPVALLSLETILHPKIQATAMAFLDKHKAIDSPYNTYKNTGLPPGTIRTPEPTFIDAVLNPAEHDYLYMCAEPGGTGKHVFEKRYRDHLKNARKYQKWLNENRIYR